MFSLKKEVSGAPMSIGYSTGSGMRNGPGTSGGFAGKFVAHEVPEDELVKAGKKKLDRSIEMEDDSAWKGIGEAFVSLADHPEEEMEPSMGVEDAEMEQLRAEFKAVSDRVMQALDGMDEPSMVKLIFQIDPDYAAGKFGSVGKDGLKSMYSGWHQQVMGDEHEDQS